MQMIFNFLVPSLVEILCWYEILANFFTIHQIRFTSDYMILEKNKGGALLKKKDSPLNSSIPMHLGRLSLNCSKLNTEGTNEWTPFIRK